jgi:hypothetical protein
MIHITRSAYDRAQPNHGNWWSIWIDVYNPNDPESALKIYTVMDQKHIQTKNCNQCDESVVESSSCCCSMAITQCERCGSTTSQGPLSLCSLSGLIHVRAGIAMNGKALVGVCPEYLGDREGQWALASDIVEVKKRISGFCWGCS